MPTESRTEKFLPWRQHARELRVNKQARIDAVVGLTRLYSLLLTLPGDDWKACGDNDYKSFGIEFVPFDLPEDQLTPAGNGFFVPRPINWIPPIDYPNYEYPILKWGTNGVTKMPKDLPAQTAYLWSRIKLSFRHYPREKVEGWKPGSVMHMAKLLPSNNPGMAERFMPLLIGQEWRVKDAYAPRCIGFPAEKAAPHILLILQYNVEPTDDLQWGELYIILATLITRSEGDKFPNFKTIPILILTLFGSMQLRFVEAFYMDERLVVRKSKRFEFMYEEQVSKNLNTVLGIMASYRVGDPSDTHHVEIGAVPPKQSFLHETLRKIIPKSVLSEGSKSITTSPILLELAKEYKMYDWLITPPPKFELPVDEPTESQRSQSHQSAVLPSEESNFPHMPPPARSTEGVPATPFTIYAYNNPQKTVEITALMNATKIALLPAKANPDETEANAS
ncbi:hypothetical protein N7454_005624 [Penicillium verhagenii]|nr:hypothetical protein N7454_005624 [Penicillium verhagenii]